MEHAIQTLNRLLDAEYGNLIHRLAEADPFVTASASDDRAVVRRMAADLERHQRGLVEMILKLRGAPAPPRYPTDLSAVHYLDLSYLMPQVISGVRRLVKTYESAGTTGHPEADALIARILDDHRRHLAELERMHANLVPAS